MAGKADFFSQIQAHGKKTALTDAHGAYTYTELLDAAQRLAGFLKTHALPKGARIAFKATPDANYVKLLWAIWLADAVAVPISLSYPAPEILYVLQNAEVSLWLIDEADTHMVELLAGQHDALPTRALPAHFELQHSSPNAPHTDQDALIIYTSGTTGKPKGAVLTHANLHAQITTLIYAWEWTAKDRILHVLPLHHIHGIVNVLLCGLYAGAQVDFFTAPKFEPALVWESWQNAHTIFMAVPTIYNRLIAHWQISSESEKVRLSAIAGRLRLMISGSAALPATTLEAWQAICGHFLLERYGMTEIGMALSNPLHAERKVSSVGIPLAGVQARLVGEQGQELDTTAEIGELQIKSPSVFRAYWGKSEATHESFTADGWFKTGDIARKDAEGYYYLLGRSSVDILKTGGYKVSALEVEEALLRHTFIKECAVVGLPDADWGDKLVAVIAWHDAQKSLTLPALREWAKQYLAPYKVPMQIHTLEALPRNAMGKVVKNDLKKMLMD